MNQDNEIFKCYICGLKYEHEMASDEDVSICIWCNYDKGEK